MRQAHYGLSQHSSREDFEPEAVVIHFDRLQERTNDGKRVNLARHLDLNPEIKKSYHDIITRRGLWQKCVSWERAAWHAGGGEIVIGGEARSNVNQRTIGICLANVGPLEQAPDGSFFYVESGNHYEYTGSEAPVWGRLSYDSGESLEAYWEPYTVEQFLTLKQILKRIEDRWPNAAANILGHEEIAMPFGPESKCDPGPAFEWSYFPRLTPRRTWRAIAGGGAECQAN